MLWLRGGSTNNPTAHHDTVFLSYTVFHIYFHTTRVGKSSKYSRLLKFILEIPDCQPYNIFFLKVSSKGVPTYKS